MGFTQGTKITTSTTKLMSALFSISIVLFSLVNGFASVWIICTLVKMLFYLCLFHRLHFLVHRLIIEWCERCDGDIFVICLEMMMRHGDCFQFKFQIALFNSIVLTAAKSEILLQSPLHHCVIEFFPFYLKRYKIFTFFSPSLSPFFSSYLCAREKNLFKIERQTICLAFSAVC